MAATSQIGTILKRIRKFRIDNSISLRALADAADLSPAALNGMDKDNWSPRPRTIERLERVMTRGWNKPPSKRAA